MFVESAKCMPKANLWIFVYKPLNKKEYLYKKIPENIKKYSKIIYLNKNTKGQADTCFIASKYINFQASIFVHSCDNYIKFNKNKYNRLIKYYDAIIFTVKPNNYHLRYPNQFGWVSEKYNKIKNINCKNTASKSPKNDYVIVGSFGFKNKEIFLIGINSLFQNKNTINNEYYMDMAFKELFIGGFKVCNFIVDDYHSWGTPQEIENYIAKNS